MVPMRILRSLQRGDPLQVVVVPPERLLVDMGEMPENFGFGFEYELLIPLAEAGVAGGGNTQVGSRPALMFHPGCQKGHQYFEVRSLGSSPATGARHRNSPPNTLTRIGKHFRA